ncbi:hypothetical protein Tco_1226319 [Tanacetum coccineum]
MKEILQEKKNKWFSSLQMKSLDAHLFLQTWFADEELAKAAKSNKIEDQMLVLMERLVETELKLGEKFRELREEMSTVVKEREDVVKELEMSSGNHVAKETARLL